MEQYYGMVWPCIVVLLIKKSIIKKVVCQCTFWVIFYASQKGGWRVANLPKIEDNDGICQQAAVIVSGRWYYSTGFFIAPPIPYLVASKYNFYNWVYKQTSTLCCANQSCSSFPPRWIGPPSSECLSGLTRLLLCAGHAGAQGKQTKIVIQGKDFGSLRKQGQMDKCLEDRLTHGGAAMASVGANGRGWIKFFGQKCFSIHSIFYYCNLLVYRWNWWIKSLAKKSIVKCLFSLMLSIFAPIFAFFTVFYLFPPPQYTIILLLLPNIMFRCCCYTCTENLTSRYVKKNHWVFLVYWISAIFLPILVIFCVFLPFLPWCTLLKSY